MTGPPLQTLGLEPWLPAAVACSVSADTCTFRSTLAMSTHSWALAVEPTPAMSQTLLSNGFRCTPAMSQTLLGIGFQSTPAMSQTLLGIGFRFTPAISQTPLSNGACKPEQSFCSEGLKSANFTALFCRRTSTWATTTGRRPSLRPQSSATRLLWTRCPSTGAAC